MLSIELELSFQKKRFGKIYFMELKLTDRFFKVTLFFIAEFFYAIKMRMLAKNHN